MKRIGLIVILLFISSCSQIDKENDKVEIIENDFIKLDFVDTNLNITNELDDPISIELNKTQYFVEENKEWELVPMDRPDMSTSQAILSGEVRSIDLGVELDAIQSNKIKVTIHYHVGYVDEDLEELSKDIIYKREGDNRQ